MPGAQVDDFSRVTGNFKSTWTITALIRTLPIVSGLPTTRYESRLLKVALTYLGFIPWLGIQYFSARCTGWLGRLRLRATACR
jgi:hypothetical protein